MNNLKKIGFLVSSFFTVFIGVWLVLLAIDYPSIATKSDHLNSFFGQKIVCPQLERGHWIAGACVGATYSGTIPVDQSQ